MDKVENQDGWKEEFEMMLQKRVGLTPPKISDIYAVLRATVIVNHRDLIKVSPEGLKQRVQDLDSDWYELLSEAERAFYRLGFEDAIQMRNR
ncbi:MAG: hypothetical protein OWQ59_04090 [Alicyclobacillaceae bacterium]|nr:hypothetical protein [Alicyclobacillaceae bacterium]